MSGNPALRLRSICEKSKLFYRSTPHENIFPFGSSHKTWPSAVNSTFGSPNGHRAPHTPCFGRPRHTGHRAQRGLVIPDGEVIHAQSIQPSPLAPAASPNRRGQKHRKQHIWSTQGTPGTAHIVFWIPKTHWAQCTTWFGDSRRRGTSRHEHPGLTPRSSRQPK